MTIEYFLETLKTPEVIELIKQLAENEQIVREEKGRGRNRDQKRQKIAERQAVDLRRSLLDQADPTLIYFYLKMTEVADADLFRTEWQGKAKQVDVWQQIQFDNQEQIPAGVFAPSIPDLESFPIGSFWISIPFKLREAYVSRDDNDLYIAHVPIQMDKVFKFPMVRSTSWKGTLRAALWQQDYPEDDCQIIRLFGSAKAEEVDFKAGRLQFYSSFFTDMGLEIINPHDRETKTGKNPILLETVPKGSISTFYLFYFPFDRIGEDEIETRKQSLKHLVLVAKGIQAMFTVYGFGAKTSSGFGTAFEGVGTGLKGVDEVANVKINLNSPTVDPTPVSLDFDHFDLFVRKAEALHRQYAEIGEGKS